MTPAELKESLGRWNDRVLAGMSQGARRLEVLAGERDVIRFLQGRQLPSKRGIHYLARIVVTGLSAQDVGLAYLEDPSAFEMTIRNPLQRLVYRAFGR